MSPNLKHLCEQVKEVARGAGALIKSEKSPAIFEKKGRANFVTSMDLASQQYIISHLKKIFPESNFVAEESEENKLLPGYNWIIDPIDGTTNYMLNFGHSCISIGLVYDNEPVLGVIYDPFLDEMYSAVAGCGAYLNDDPIHVHEGDMEKSVIIVGTAFYYRELADITFRSIRAVFDECGDIRRTGSAALDLCYVAAGKCDAYFEFRLQPWDYAAGVLIAREAGAKVVGLLDGEIDFTSPVGILAGSPANCDFIYELIEKQR